QGKEIGIRKIAVVLRIFLRAHGARFIPVRVIEARLLLDRAAAFEDLDLARRFVLDRLFHEAELREVRDLAAGAETGIARLPDRDVGVAAERTFLQVAVADPDPDHQRVKRARVGDRFGGAAQFRFGDDFQQRRASAVEVDAAHLGEVLVQRLAGVLLEMGAREPDGLLFLADEKAHRAALHDRYFVLADLVALGKVRVEVVLAREHGARADLALHCQAEADGVLDRGTVGHRQGTGQRDVDRGSLRVRRRAERVRRAREHLAPRQELRMRLDADDDFPAHATTRISTFRAAAAAGRRPGGR